MATGKRRLIEEAKARVEQILEERINEEGMTLDEIEAVVESTMRDVADWVEERLIEEQRPPKSNRAACPRCAAGSKYKRKVDISVLTIHGSRKIRRRYHYCSACDAGFSPMDAVLGLEPGRDATRQVRAWQGKYGSDSAFAAVPELFRELRGIEVSASTVERTTIDIGTRLRAAERAWGPPPAAEAGGHELGSKRLYLSMDGTMCRLRDPWRRDGSLGKLKCRYGEAKLGIAFQTSQQDGLVAKGASQFEILRVAQSDAVNYDMLTEDLIKKITEYDRAYGIDIFHAETDTIEFRFPKLPADMPGFCKDLYKFCPDIVDQGVGTVEALDKEIRGTQEVFLWWD